MSSPYGPSGPRRMTRSELIRDIAIRRITQHMHALDPAVIASAEMSHHKQPGPFATTLEAVIRDALTRFDAAALVEQAMHAVGVPDA